MEEDIGTSQFEESHPVFWLLTPTNFDAAPLGQPTQCSLHDPTFGRETGFTRDRAFLDFRFIAPPAMFYMLLVALRLHKLVDIRVIIAFVQAHILFAVRTLNHDVDHQVIHRPFVMLVGSRDMHRQRSAAFVDQQMDFCPRFAPIRRVSPGFCTAQGGRHHLAVRRLPFPANLLLSGIEANDYLEQFVKNARPRPFLEALMQGAAGDVEPLALDRFPLAARPQHIPDAINHIPLLHPRSTGSTPFGLGQMLLQLSP